jgi:Tol biopolymer transport system component
MRRTIIALAALITIVGCSSSGDHFKVSKSRGKVVYSSDATNPAQLYIKDVDSIEPPRQITKEIYGSARNPKWSQDGRYIVYVTTDPIIDQGHSLTDALVVIEDVPPPDVAPRRLTIHARDFGTMHFAYPQWSNDGKKIVFMVSDENGVRGLGLVTFEEPYLFDPHNTSHLLAATPDMNPGEPIFSDDGAQVYFAADPPSGPPKLFIIQVTDGTLGPVNDRDGKQVQSFYAPSLSPDGTRLMYNTETWKNDSQFGEEVLELNLGTGAITRITTEPGDQYAMFAKNGSGEMLLLTNNTDTKQYALYTVENGVRTLLDTGDPENRFKESGDWWKQP